MACTAECSLHFLFADLGTVWLRIYYHCDDTLCHVEEELAGWFWHSVNWPASALDEPSDPPVHRNGQGTYFSLVFCRAVMN